MAQAVRRSAWPSGQVEQAVRDHKQVAVKEHVRGGADSKKPADVRAIEEDLQRSLARKVELQTSGAAAQKGCSSPVGKTFFTRPSAAPSGP